MLVIPKNKFITLYHEKLNHRIKTLLHWDMNSTVDELKQMIRLFSASGSLSDADRRTLYDRAAGAGLSRGEMDLVIESVLLEHQDMEESESFVPKPVHIIVSVLVIVILSVLILLSMRSGGDNGGDGVGVSQRARPIAPGDLVNIYSGTYDGKSILVSIREVRGDGDSAMALYDLKCDFVPVLQGASCKVDLQARRFCFDEADMRKCKLSLSDGLLERTAAGKIVMKSSCGSYELVQL